jgi:hypothetical protein
MRLANIGEVGERGIVDERDRSRKHWTRNNRALKFCWGLGTRFDMVTLARYIKSLSQTWFLYLIRLRHIYGLQNEEFRL